MTQGPAHARGRPPGRRSPQCLQGRFPVALGEPFKNRFDARALLARQFELMPDREDAAFPVLGVEHAIVGFADRSLEMIEVGIDKM